MTPPELSGDTPVFDFFQPVKVNLFESFRNVSQVALLGSFDSWFCKFFHCNEPLVGKHGFDNCVASVAFACRDYLFFSLYKVACCFEVCHPCLTAFVTVHTFVLACCSVHCSIFVDACRHFKTGSLTNFEVVRVVSRSDFNCTCTLFRIRVGVSDDRNFLANERKDNLLAYHVFISFVVRVDSDCHVGEHCFRSGCCNYDTFTLAVCCRVSEVPVLAVSVFVFNFCIGKRSLTFRTPVDESVASVDEALFV